MQILKYFFVLLSIWIALPARSAMAESLFSGTPLLAIAGTIRPDVSADILAMTYDEKLNRLEVTLNNINPDTSLKYSDSPLLRPGSVVTMSVSYADADVAIFEGTVSTFAPNFPAGSAPTLRLLAAGKRRPVVRLQASAALGGNLLEFYPVLKGSLIKCTGVTDGNPNIRQRTTLVVSGVGETFTDNYIVSSTVHSFDLVNGYRTHFTASVRVPAGN